MAGTLGGAFMMAFRSNRCEPLGWSNYVQEMIGGHIIIVVRTWPLLCSTQYV